MLIYVNHALLVEAVLLLFKEKTPINEYIEPPLETSKLVFVLGEAIYITWSREKRPWTRIDSSFAHVFLPRAR